MFFTKTLKHIIANKNIIKIMKVLSSLTPTKKIELILGIILIFALFYTAYVAREVAVNPEITGYPFRQTILVSMGISCICMGLMQLIDEDYYPKFFSFVGIITGISSLVLYSYL